MCLAGHKQKTLTRLIDTGSLNLYRVGPSGKLAYVWSLIALALTVGLADSVNPSTIGPALYLATGAAAVRRVLAFTVGVLAVYFIGGVVLTLGPGQAILRLFPHPSRHATHLIELCVGIALAFVAVALWLARQRVAAHLAREETKIRRSSIVVGATIMAVELPTAFPYFALIAAIVGSGRSVLSQITLLVIFNIAFIIPLLLIAATRSLAADGGRRALERVRLALDRRAALLIPVLILAVALVIASIGTIGLAGGLD